MKPDYASRPLDWRRFWRCGMDTATGHSDPRDAAVQMLILPVLILLWAIIILVICALV